MCSHVNIGSGKDLTIKELAETIKEIIGFEGKINFDSTKPDGMPRKLLNSDLLNNLGFKNIVNLREGLTKTYQNYLKLNENI